LQSKDLRRIRRAEGSNIVVKELTTLLGFKVDQSGAKQYEEIFNRIKGFAMRAVALIGGVELIKSIIETTSAWQQENLQLSYIIGNTEKAHALMLRLNELAARSPFTREELAGYAKQLINFGFSVEEITPLMSRLANIAAVLGTDKIPLITESLARMKTRGYADARVMMELFHAGIPIQEELAKRFGVSTFQMNKLIQEGRVGFRDVYNALTAMTTGTGKFAGAAEANARTLGGLWKSVQHILEDLKTTIGTSLLPVVENLLMQFRNWLDVNKGHLADDMIRLLNTIAYTLGWMVGRVKDFLKLLGILPDTGPKPVDTGPGAARAEYKPNDPLSRLGRGESLADILKNPTGVKAPDVTRLGGLAAIRAAEAGSNLPGRQGINIHNELHLTVQGSVGDDAAQRNLMKLIEEGTEKGLTKAIRKTVPSFSGGLTK